MVAAAFYLAGQLFRRSGRLKIQAMEFQRAAIAMEVTESLAKLIGPEFRRSVYEYHLKGSESCNVVESDDAVVKALEVASKMRGSQ